MDKSMKIILAALVIITLGYFAYTSTVNEDSTDGEDFVVDSSVKDKTEKFIKYREQLGSINLSIGLFTDPVFRSYKSFSSEVTEMDFGREDPFRKIYTDTEESEN